MPPIKIVGMLSSVGSMNNTSSCKERDNSWSCMVLRRLPEIVSVIVRNVAICSGFRVSLKLEMVVLEGWSPSGTDKQRVASLGTCCAKQFS